MKMTWKKSTNEGKIRTRKRPANPNLPFEDLNSSFDKKEEGAWASRFRTLGHSAKAKLPDTN